MTAALRFHSNAALMVSARGRPIRNAILENRVTRMAAADLEGELAFVVGRLFQPRSPSSGRGAIVLYPNCRSE